MASGHVYRAHRPHGCSDQCCDVKILFANPKPSTHGPSRHIAPPRDLGRYQSIAEVDGQPSIAEGDARDPKRSFDGR
jgi:hypothetical protein